MSNSLNFYESFLADWSAVLKRQDACVQVAKDFVKFYKKRADVEQKYAKELVKKKKKWIVLLLLLFYFELI
jgi:hypothetical protein